MNKIIKTLMFTGLLSTFALTGCDMLNKISNLGNDSEEGEKAELPYTSTQAKANFKAEGLEDGIEVDYVTFNDNDEDENFTVGLKGNMLWQYDEEGNKHVALLDENNVLKTYEYNFETNVYELKSDPLEDGADEFELAINSYCTMFYQYSQYEDSHNFKKIKDLTFAGRSAGEYRYTLNAVLVKVNITFIIDNELGITLRWDVEGKAFTGEGDSGAAYEVTEIRTGNQIAVPVVE